MPSTRVRCFIVFAILSSPVTFANAQVSKHPLKDSELIALVSGGALSENTVHEIRSRGLDFRPNEEYRSLLATAGANASVLTALNAAKTSDGAAAPEIDQLLKDLAIAGKQIRAKQFPDAIAALNDALQLQFNGGMESAFVMAESLRQQEHWGEANLLYSEVLSRGPDFPQIHTKISYAFYRIGDEDSALREARTALAEDPQNAEAHKNAGLALQAMNEFTASEQEYDAALRIKPDYDAVRYNLGLLFYNQRNLDRALAEYKKAVALNPEVSDYHNNLGITYQDKGDLDSAIREFREAKRISPRAYIPRQNLGGALMRHRMYAQAVAEFRELEAQAPDSAMCHECFAKALFSTWDLTGAEKEFRKAMELDPSDAGPHIGIGDVHDTQKDYDAALDQYRQALQLDNSSDEAWRDTGRVLLEKNDVPNAIEALKRAENLGPNDANVRDLYGQALQKSGDYAAATGELRQALALDPKGTQIQLELAAALEKNKDWVESLDQYRLAALADPSPSTQAQYKAALERMNKLIVDSSGASAEAAKLKAEVRAARVDPDISHKLDLTLQTGNQAIMANRLDQAEKSYKEALDLAQKLQPHDDRLTAVYMALANVYGGKKDLVQAGNSLQQALKSSVDLYGAESPMTSGPLQALGALAIFKSDYKSAEDFLQRAVDINKNTFGETSDKYADSLRVLSNVYIAQNDYDKAELALQRAVHIDEALMGKGNVSPLDMVPQWYLCVLYDKWHKPAKAEPCYEKMLGIEEGQFGSDSPMLLSTLTREAQALRKLGREDQAAKIEQRAQSIQTAETKSN